MVDDWRFVVARPLTGEILDWDLPLRDVEFTRALTASPSLRASINPADKADILMANHTDGHPILDYWNSVIYAVDPAGKIRYGGLLVQPSRKGADFSFECTGYLGWLARQYYVGPRIVYTGGDYADPVGALDVPGENGGIVRTLVRAAQGHPDADMGIMVDGATASKVRIGSSEQAVEFTPWEHPSIGDKIIEFAGNQPGFDVIESHEWAHPEDNEDSEIKHRLTLHYPRAGRRRTDLMFQSGVNIQGEEPEIADGDEYANVVIGDGAGEGSKALRETYPTRDGRPRVMASVDAKHLTTSDQLKAYTKAEAQARTAVVKVSSIEVMDHPAARLGAWDLGDDVFVQIESDWGMAEGWYRIVGDTWHPANANVATISLAPANSFRYGAAV